MNGRNEWTHQLDIHMVKRKVKSNSYLERDMTKHTGDQTDSRNDSEGPIPELMGPTQAYQ